MKEISSSSKSGGQEPKKRKSRTLKKIAPLSMESVFLPRDEPEEVEGNDLMARSRAGIDVRGTLELEGVKIAPRRLDELEKVDDPQS